MPWYDRNAGSPIPVVQSPATPTRGPEIMRMAAALVMTIVAAPTLRAQTPSDTAAIRAAALDYAEGWYAGDADRMARALHPELVKRIVVADSATKRSFVQTMGATSLVNATRHGYGKSTPAASQQRDVSVLDVYGNAAVAKIVMAEWIDYLQLGKLDGRWQIVNVLWEQKPEK